MKKLKIKNIFQPTPTNLVRWAWAIKAATGSTGISLIIADYKWLGISIALIGAAADFIISLFNINQNENEQIGN